MSEVNLRWTKNSLDPDYEGTPKHYMYVIKHGDSKFFYLDLGKDEAERLFKEEMRSRTEIQAMIEPKEAEGHIIDFDDRFYLWENPQNDLQKMIDFLFNSSEE